MHLSNLTIHNSLSDEHNTSSDEYISSSDEHNRSSDEHNTHLVLPRIWFNHDSFTQFSNRVIKPVQLGIENCKKKNRERGENEQFENRSFASPKSSVGAAGARIQSGRPEAEERSGLKVIEGSEESMSRLSFRPRPLDIHKKLPIVKSIKEFEDDDTPLTSSTRNSHILRLAASEVDNEVHHVPSKKNAPEIPTPEYVVVDTYERDYSSTFMQPTSYLRARGARAEIGEFVEYDLDNEDEDWLQEFNNDKNIIAPEKFESILFKLEVLDHKAREKAGLITASLGSPIPVLLQLDAASEALQAQSVRYPLIQAVYIYWKAKRERWQKPILRRLQPPPPLNDTNPYNVFRPREKAHKLHTRRMQRRENNVQSFEKLRQVRRNLEQAKTILEGLIKREEKKREVIESEVSLQRIQLKYRHETELLEDSLALSGFPSLSSRQGFSEEEFMDSDDVPNSRLHHIRPPALQNHHYTDTKPVIRSMGNMKREFRRRHELHGWLLKLDPNESMLLFTKPLVPDKLAAAGIIPPATVSLKSSDPSTQPHNIRGRIGRGGRIIFDRCNPLAR